MFSLKRELARPLARKLLLDAISQGLLRCRSLFLSSSVRCRSNRSQMSKARTITVAIAMPSVGGKELSRYVSGFLYLQREQKKYVGRLSRVSAVCGSVSWACLPFPRARVNRAGT